MGSVSNCVFKLKNDGMSQNKNSNRYISVVRRMLSNQYRQYEVQGKTIDEEMITDLGDRIRGTIAIQIMTMILKRYGPVVNST